MSPMPDGGRENDEPILDPEDARRADDASALTPDDLDIEDEDNVVSLEEDRYVIGTDDRPEVSDDDEEEEYEEDGETLEEATAPEPDELDSETVKDFLADELEGVSAQYGFHITVKSEDATTHQQMLSDDVGTVFDSLLRWYAQQLTNGTAVEDVLGILLTESNVRVRYSPSCLQAILEAYDLGPEDSIADLFEAVQDDRGMVFPPKNV